MKRLTAWAKKENIGLAKAQPSKRGYQREHLASVSSCLLPSHPFQAFRHR